MVLANSYVAESTKCTLVADRGWLSLSCWLCSTDLHQSPVQMSANICNPLVHSKRTTPLLYYPIPAIHNSLLIILQFLHVSLPSNTVHVRFFFCSYSFVGFGLSYLPWVLLAVQSIVLWIMLCYLQRFLLKALLIYKGWMFDPRG